MPLLQADLSEIAKLLRHPGSEPLSEEDGFCHRMAVLRANSDYIFRYRAIWDKIMGLFILLSAPDQFQKFLSANSRKKDFKKIATKSGRIPAHVVDRILQVTQTFDDRHRTAEAHLRTDCGLTPLSGILSSGCSSPAR